MTTIHDRRVWLRAIVVLVLAAAAITVFSVLVADSAQAADVATHAVAADAGTDDVTTTDATTTTGGSGRVLQAVVNGLIFGSLLALASVGLSLIYGTTGLSNFAHGEQVSFGAVLTYFLVADDVSLPLIPGTFGIGIPLIPAALLAVAISAGTGWLQDKFLWSPLRRRRVGIVQQMIVSIGLSLAMLNMLQWWMGGGRMRLTTSIADRLQIGPVQISTQTLWSVLIAILCLLGVSYFLLRTRLGRATRAVSDNPALASASGIKVESIIRLVWILAAGLAGLGGILLGLYEQGTAFDAGARLLLLMFAAVTLGGLGQPFGALVGSLVIGLVAELSTLWLPADLKVATALVILIGVLLVRPQGILGRAERVG
ncbi:branched-chain amino acid ABC transporter permease [Demequina sp. NBRC 110052]|uniref:branched-chain amino acid ABC transporter permease n=1 Tax=Demequina sp. NBRC 110052 TaxID=1570341 RepID=UPI001F1E032B|nr:branched-chain amino acid ABC transporter permease [Demequina sp. NBRC 110052]